MRNEGLEHPDITYCRIYGYPPRRSLMGMLEEPETPTDFDPWPSKMRKRILRLKRRTKNK